MTPDNSASVDLEDLWGVYAVPPLPRKADSRRSLDLDAAERVARHIADGGITRFLYGGNAFLYHVSLAEYETCSTGWPDLRRPGGRSRASVLHSGERSIRPACFVVTPSPPR